MGVLRFPPLRMDEPHSLSVSNMVVVVAWLVNSWSVSLQMAACLWLVVHLLLFSSSSAHNDFFTSIGEFCSSSSRCSDRQMFRQMFWSLIGSPGHMTDLLVLEENLLSSLKIYISAEEDKLQRIKE